MNSLAEDPDAVPIRPAATVIPLRDGTDGLEVLVLRRDTKLAFHGGSWVFPGGRVDDHELAVGDDEVAARLAAVREANEEAGLVLETDVLVPLSHWTTPHGRNRRFATWFYVAPAPAGEIVIDDGEIRAHAWHTIDAAIGGCEAGEVQLAAPTYISLLRLRKHGSVAAALAATAARTNEVFLPRLMRDGDELYSVYQQDPAYESGDLNAPGPRHRTRMLDIGFDYRNDIDPPEQP